MSRALFRLVSGARKAQAPVVRQQVRNDSSNGYLGNVVAIPCREKVSVPEQTALAATMVCCWLAIPAWVLYHVRDYNGTRDAVPE